jgi:hypothetical protein
VPFVLKRRDGSCVATEKATYADLDDAIRRLDEKADTHRAKADKLRRLREALVTPDE